MSEEEQVEKKEYSTFKEISFLSKSQKQNKYIINRGRIGFIILANIIIIPVSMFTGAFNPILFFLSVFKIILTFSLLFSMIYLAIGDPNSTKNWQVKSTRKNEILGRILHVLKEAGIMLIISGVIFGLFHISGFPKTLEASFLEENPGVLFPLGYIPTTAELLLIIAIILMLLVTQFTLIYWFYSRCTQFTGYNVEKKIQRLNFNRILLGLFVNAAIFGIILTVIFDDLFVATKFPNIMASWSKYETIFSSNPYIILVAELSIIILINVYYIIDGLIANNRRTNFIKLDLLENQ
ncbi:MAG: hypothetical protein HZR80_18805 [Candidatus Heimdallarchaeota archaeon]